MKHYPWIMPLVVLVALLLLFGLRWETGPQKTFDNRTEIYKNDRWSNTTWKITYYYGSLNRTKEELVNIPYFQPERPQKPGTGFSVFQSQNWKEQLETEVNISEEELSAYQTALQQYENDVQTYMANMTDYIKEKKAIRNLLTFIWSAITIAVSVVLYRNARKLLKDPS